ncbi:Hypothetical predicted protein, partial [Paramuricea clavata]
TNDALDSNKGSYTEKQVSSSSTSSATVKNTVHVQHAHSYQTSVVQTTVFPRTSSEQSRLRILTRAPAVQSMSSTPSEESNEFSIADNFDISLLNNPINTHLPIATNHIKFTIPLITIDDILNLAAELDQNKSTGLDGISAYFIKSSIHSIAPIILRICNMSIENGVFPNMWKKARLIPIYKAKTRTERNNYRPISILPILSKLLERHVANSYVKFLTENDILSSCQHGFRAHHSCESTLISLILICEHLLDNIEQGLINGIALTDLSKAFDLVDHRLLLQKLEQYGITPIALKWFKSYLNDRYQVVQIASSLSNPALIKSGVPQGSILGPILFLIFINDLPSYVGSSKPFLFVDDSTLISSGSDLHELSVSLKKKDFIASDFDNDLVEEIPLSLYEIFDDPNDLLDYILPTNDTVSQITLNINGKEISDPIEVGDLFNEYFSSVADNFDISLLNNPINTHLPIATNHIKFTIPLITIDDILNLAAELDQNKSTGLDGIPAYFIKSSKHSIAPIILSICNMSIENGVFPNMWKKARLIPIYKAETRTERNNYRPISILPILSKLLERHVANSYVKFLTENDILSSCQHGFRAHHSCESTLISLILICEHLLDNIEQGLINGIALIDLSKAFDLVDHRLLLQKLEQYGITPIALKWFKSYLNDRYQVVKIASSLSNPALIKSGVPQGSILGPILFLIFINDLPSYVGSSKPFLFVDDSTLISSGSDLHELSVSLKSDMTSVSRWTNHNKMSLLNEGHSLLTRATNFSTKALR